ncbi:ABC transporter permease [Sulfuriflexus sp.]|uniref:ABC transporter permease n=1 Tax=Sulfuriflexus sp. TaxID=2015443 RepID=UPI0028CEC591|nr:ABC transporter permease [Sulfuriflexus sp.]MDT8403708.1 ABC transporter permease [Sulfuriflexus sp.]
MKQYLAYLPGSLLLIWVVLAVASLWLPLSPEHIALEHILQSPTLANGLGYDDLGRPVLDRLLLGARTSLAVAFAVMLISLVVGTVVGVLSAWWGGYADQLLMRITDIFLAFPGILLALALAGLLGPGILNVVIALSVVGWVGFARLARAQVLVVREREHLQAARALGSSQWRCLWQHVLPLIAAPLIVEATFAVSGLIVAEAGLSFLGLGVQPPASSWGSMLCDGARYLLVAPHLVVIPGLALMSIVLAVNLLGDQLRDRLDVKA